MRWVQFTVPAPATGLLRDSLKLAVRAGKLKGPDEKAALDLIDFFTYAADNPTAFPPTGTMATSLKLRARRIDGVRRNDGGMKDDEPRKRAHRKTKRPTRHQKRLEATKLRKERDRAERQILADQMASHGQQPVPLRKRLFSGRGNR